MYFAKKALLINDDQQLLNAMATILRNENFEVVTALGGKQGLMAIRDASFDLVITDITMSYCSGFELIAETKENADTKDTSIFVISSIGNESTIAECFEMGVDAYIQKPFVPKSFLYNINRILFDKAYALAS